jgi:uncharacterized membrane protein
VIPGLVISVAWSLALCLFVDQQLAPMEALKTSYDLTYGYKWTILLGSLALGIIMLIVAGILTGIGQLFSETLGGILGFIGILITIPLPLGGSAYIYRVLTSQTGPQ